MAQVRKYESVVLVNPELNESQVKDELKKIENLLSSNQAEKINVERWGRNPIAYKAKRFNYAHFVCFKYESANHGVVEALSAILRISDNVLKFQTHYINEKVRKFKGNPKRRPDDEFSRESDDLMLDADY